MSTGKFYEIIEKQILDFYSMKKEPQLNKMNRNEVALLHYIKSSVAKQMKFIVLLEPNSFLQHIYDWLSFNGAASIADLTIAYQKTINKFRDTPYAKDSIRIGINDELKFLRTMRIIRSEAIPIEYKKKSVDIWIAPFATDKQIAEAKNNYAGYTQNYYDNVKIHKKDGEIIHYGKDYKKPDHIEKPTKKPKSKKKPKPINEPKCGYLAVKCNEPRVAGSTYCQIHEKVMRGQAIPSKAIREKA